MSIASTRADLDFPAEILSRAGEIITVECPGLPAQNPAEADTFARHEGIPGHNQHLLSGASAVLAGAGGLNSWTALALLRSGIRQLTIIDPDFVERTNMPRQFYFGADLGQPKTSRLIENLKSHAVSPAMLTGAVMRFEEAMERFALPADVFVIGVDRNDCRRSAVEIARRRKIPAVFTMLSADGMRCHCFLQGPGAEDACLWCAFPNLDPQRVLPCASAIVTACMLASAYTVFYVHRALMGWPDGCERHNLREADLLAMTPERASLIPRRKDCPVCSNLR